MKRRLMTVLAILALIICLVLSGCGKNEAADETNEPENTKIEETEKNPEPAEPVEPDEPDVPDEPVEEDGYSDVEAIRTLYEEQGNTVIDILDPRYEELTYDMETSEFKYVLKGDYVVVWYYPNESYLAEFDWFNVKTGEAVNANYWYDLEGSFAKIDYLDTQTLQLLEEGTFGQLVTLKYDGNKASYTIQDYFREFTPEQLCWEMISPMYCAYLHDAELSYDLIENSVRLGFTGTGEFDVPVPHLPPMFVLFGYDELCQYLEISMPDLKVKDKLTDGGNMAYIIMYNTLIEDGFAVPVQDKSSGVRVTNVICLGKDTLVEIKLNDSELSHYTLRWVWTESNSVPGLQIIFDDDGILDVSEEE